MDLNLSWSELARLAGGKLVQGDGADIVRAIGTDTRKLAAGQVFWALKGDRYDAHDFLEDRKSVV